VSARESMTEEVGKKREKGKHTKCFLYEETATCQNNNYAYAVAEVRVRRTRRRGMKGRPPLAKTRSPYLVFGASRKLGVSSARQKVASHAKLPVGGVTGCSRDRVVARTIIESFKIEGPNRILGFKKSTWSDGVAYQNDLLLPKVGITRNPFMDR